MNRSVAARAVCALVGLAVSASAANAAMITFIHTGIGSGTLDGVPFSNAQFSITAVGDTDNLSQVFSHFSSIAHASASITIQGIGTIDFVTPTATAVNNNLQIAAFARDLGGGIISDLGYFGRDAALGAWDMLTSIGPVNGDGDLLQWSLSPVVTSAGVLVFASAQDAGGTFQAIVVPAPASIGVLTLGGMIVTRRHRDLTSIGKR